MTLYSRLKTLETEHFMDQKFRQNKYFNESGSKTGSWYSSWYINRLDYFEFYSYPHCSLHQLLALFIALVAYCFAISLFSKSFLLALCCCYLAYVASLTLYLLRRKICRYRGYRLYPKKFTDFFYDIRIDVDLDDFDSIATLNK
jgi:hypothetical protein